MVPGKLLHPNKYAAFGILLTVLTLSGLLGELNFKQANSSPPLQRLYHSENLSDGDLVFRKGRDMVSRLVLTQGQSPRFSHVGVIIKNGEQASVVHALPEGTTDMAGVQLESLSSFSSFENATDIVFYRYKGINNALREKIRRFALKQIGKPFDDKFLLSSDDAFYCTELVLKAFQSAGVNLTSGLQSVKIMLIDEEVIPPDHLRQSDYFLPVIVQEILEQG